MLLTTKGQSVRTRVKEIRETGRGAKGVRLVNLEEGDKLLAIAKVVESDAEEAANSGGSTPPVEVPPA
jgi:DNA gyrase subunit A